MLAEFITSLITPCPPYVRGMGYLHEALAIRGRYRRCQSAWRGHLERSCDFVRTCAEGCHDRRQVVVLGAGLLLDVPLAVLTTIFARVILVDVVFLPEVRRRVKSYRNVVLIEQDVTNMATTLYQCRKQGLLALPPSVPDIPSLVDGAGLVVSANILSQLTAVPLAYARKHWPSLAAARGEDWCRQIMEAHYRALLATPGAVCLIADYAFEERDRRGEVVNCDSTVFDLPLPRPDRVWEWEIAPPGEQDRRLCRSLQVGGWSMVKEKVSSEGRGVAAMVRPPPPSES